MKYCFLLPDPRHRDASELVIVVVFMVIVMAVVVH